MKMSFGLIALAHSWSCEISPWTFERFESLDFQELCYTLEPYTYIILVYDRHLVPRSFLQACQTAL